MQNNSIVFHKNKNFIIPEEISSMLEKIEVNLSKERSIMQVERNGQTKIYHLSALSSKSGIPKDFIYVSTF